MVGGKAAPGCRFTTRCAFKETGRRKEALTRPIISTFFLLALIPFLAFALWGCCGETKPQERPAPTSPFTIATYNINWGNVDLGKTVEVIRKAKADVVFLQETNAESERHLRGYLSGDYPHIMFRGGEGNSPGERLGFLSKSPIANLQYLEAKYGIFGTWIGEVRLAGRTVQVVNVHLQPVLVPAGESFVSAWKLLQQGEAIHAKEIVRIHRSLAHDMPVIIAGDLNSLPAFTAPRFLISRGFVDSFASMTENPDAYTTWRWRWQGIDLAARLDYIFHTKAIRTIESGIINSSASDHSLVVSTLKWMAE